MIPKDKITNSIDSNIKIVGKCKNYPIYYADVMLETIKTICYVVICIAMMYKQALI